MGDAEISRAIAEGNIQNKFRRSHRWQKAVLGVSLAAGALAGVNEVTDGAYGEPWTPMLEVAAAASVIGSANRIMTRKASTRSVKEYALIQNDSPEKRHHETTISVHNGKLQVKREYSRQTEVSVSFEQNANALLAPILVYAGTTLAAFTASNEEVRQIGATIPGTLVGAVVVGSGILLHRRDHSDHESIEKVYRKQLDNIDDGVIYKADYSE